MKISTILPLIGILISSYSISQEQNQIYSIQKGQPQTRTASTGGTYVSGGVKKEEKPQVKLHDLSLAEVEEYLKSYKEKYNYVKSNPSEDKQAQESGWYVQMERKIGRLEARRKELLNASSK